MPKCPNCEEEIDTLDNIVSGENVYKMSISNYKSKEGYVDYETDDFYPDSKENRFECHECQFVIALTEEQAIAFLKGKKVEITKEDVIVAGS